MEDTELVQRVKDGDGSAFEILVRLHYRAAYNMAFRFMKDHGATDDVVQDSFLKAHKAIDSFRGDSAFKSWLLRITANTAKNALRSKHMKSRVDLEEAEMGVTHADFSGLERAQTSEVLQWTIDQLPEKQRIALQLRIFEDMSFKEVAAAMECPFDTAKANFRHAVLNLRKILKASQGGRAYEEVKQAFESLQEDYDHDR
ncbi:sigma-70 family RNA polymerase sigma factor [bacterium]|nr:sigma-70 family RNA polymerase sigma factor [bacterium]